MAITDWEKSPLVDFSLTTFYYHSAPSSMVVITDDSCDLGLIYCKNANALCIPEGRLSVWLFCYDKDFDFLLIALRSQDAVGAISNENLYYLKIYDGHCKVFKRVADVDTELDDFAFTVAAATWFTVRVTWAVQGSNLIITVEYQPVPGSWALVGSCNTGSNLWAASSVNRVAVGVVGEIGASHEINFDDIAIFRRLPT